MMYRFTAFLLISTLVFLGGCTGTAAETEPLFVIAGVQDPPRVLILQDRVFEELPQGEPRFIEFTALPLLAIPRAFDVVDRAGTREELVVLSRAASADAAGSIPAFIDFFNTRGLLADDEATFRTSRTTLDLRTLTYPFPLADLCPVDLEVTRAGNYVVFFNSPRVCNPTTKLETDNVMVVLSTPRDATASVVSSFQRNNNFNPLLTSGVTSGSHIPTGMFIDQSSDALYYIRRNASRLTLRRLEVGTYTTAGQDPERDISTTPPISENISINNLDFRDLTKVSSNMAILGTNVYVLAPLSGTNVTLTTVNTQNVRSQDPRAFVPDPSTNRLFILDDNDKLVYHADPTNETNTDTDIPTGSVSTINTDSSYLYVAGNDAMNIVDLLPLNEGNTNIDSLLSDETCAETPTSGVCELNNPTALTWAEGILPPE